MSIIKYLWSLKEKDYPYILVANFSVNFLMMGLPLIFAFFLLPSDIGIIKIFQSYLSIFILIAGFGLNSGIIKYCSENKIDKEKLFKSLLSIGILFSVFITIILLVFIKINLFSDDESVNKLLFFGSLVIPLSVINLNARNYFQASIRFKELAKLDIILSLFNVVMTLILTYFYSLIGFFIGYNVSVVINLIVYLSVLKIKINFNNFNNIIGTVKKHSHIVKFSFFSFLSNSLGVINATMDIIMLSLLSVDLAMIGYYAIAQILITGLRQFYMAANQSVFPKLSASFSSGKNKNSWRQIYKKHNKFLRKITVFVIIFSIIIFAIAKLFFNTTYSNAMPIFIILIVGLLFWSLYTIKGMTLLASGRSDLNFYTSFGVLIFNILLNVVLIKKYGVFGAAYSTVISYFLFGVIIHLIFKKVLMKNEGY